MPVGQQPYQDPLHETVLTDDFLPNLCLEGMDEPRLPLDQFANLTKACEVHHGIYRLLYQVVGRVDTFCAKSLSLTDTTAKRRYEYTNSGAILQHSLDDAL